jgi:predicted transcriptional regulator
MTRSLILLLSIRPIFAAAIYNRDKVYEFRRSTPRYGMPGPAFIYETMPIGRVTGWTYVSAAVPIVPGEAGELATKQDPFAETYELYLKGAKSPCALALSFVSRFATPIRLSAMSSRPLRPPQSFCYLDSGWLSARPPLLFCHSNAIHAAAEPAGSSDVR